MGHLNNRRSVAISDAPPLPWSEQQALIVQAQAGDREALDTLLVTNWPMICRAASGAARLFDRSSVVDIDDLISEGALCLRHCIALFRPELGRRLSTYFMAAYRRWVLRYYHFHGLPLKVPLHGYHAGSARCRAAWDRLANAEALGGESVEVLADPRTEDDDGPEWEITEALQFALERCTERYREVVLARVVEGLTLGEIGERLGLTKERVRQIEMAALATMREALERRDAS